MNAGRTRPKYSRRQFLQSSLALGAGASLAHAEGIRKPAGTAFVYDPRYLQHDLGDRHPESPRRLQAILKRLEQGGVKKDLRMLGPAVDPTAAIGLNHSKAHIRRVQQQRRDDAVCRLAVAGALTAVDAVFAGKVRNAFCAIRPPGHHAENKGEYGFCFYNNAAIAARYAKHKHKIRRVLIVDWDYHHGNGTQWSFYEDPSVLFFSTHDLQAFPGRNGSADRKGKGKGLGYNINAPLPKGATDKQILDAFEKKMLPAANRLKPELVLISAGFDSRKDDSLGRFNVTDDGFKRLTKLMLAIAAEHCRSRLVSVLEGGYNTAGLALAVEAHLQALLNGANG